jgi:hypothetical protein
MMATGFAFFRRCAGLALVLAPALAHAQSSGPALRVQVAAGAGFLTSGAYFTGPGRLALDAGDAFAGALQVSVTVSRELAVVGSVAHARPGWRLTGVPLVGAVAVPGGGLWFADAALRGQARLGPAVRAPVAFAQAGAGLARYSLSTTLLGTAIDEHATNFALALGAGVALPLGSRLGLEVMAKDYIASFESVRDLAALGVEGRRAHTVVLLVSGRVGL